MPDLTYDPASHYDRVTAAWQWIMGDDLHYGVFERPDQPLAGATARLTDLMMEGARLAPGLEVLDVGCGTGGPACHLARLGARVTGISTSEQGIAQATARAEVPGATQPGACTFVVADALDTGFDDSRFDLVWVLESSHLIRDRPGLISECARVLRPGGRFVLCDIILCRAMVLDEVRRLRQPLEVLRWAFGDARMEALATYVELAQDAGIEVDQVIDLTTETRPTLDHWVDNAQRHRDRVLPVLGDQGLAQFIEACGLLAGFWDDGTLGYGLLAGTYSS
ncbi:MAG TPA: methyltransferase domain-containing protein [Acidimicrobiales bacterium]